MIHNRFRFNIKFKFLGEFVARISSLLFYAAAARLLGTEQFGLFSQVFAYAIIFIVFIELGTNSIITRNIARDHQLVSEIVLTSTTLKLMLLPIAFLLLHLLVVILGYPDTFIRLTHIMGFFALGTALGEHQSAILSGVERMDIEARLKIVWKVGALCFSIVLFIIFKSLEAFILGMTLGQWIGVGFGFYWIHRKITPLKFHINFIVLKSLLKTSLPLFFGWGFFILYDNQDILILSVLQFTNQEIGLFSASAKLIDAIRPIPVLFTSALFPILSEAARHNRPLFIKLTITIFKYTVLLLPPFLFVGSYLSFPICRFIFGVDYLASGTVLKIAMWGFGFIFLNNIVLQLLVSVEAQKKFLFGGIIVCLSNAILCYTLFSLLGIVGGAWALLGSEMILLIFSLLAISSILKQDRSTILNELMMPFVYVLILGCTFGILNLIISTIGAFTITAIIYTYLVIKYEIIDLVLLKRLIR